MVVVRATKSYSLYCFSSLGLLCLALHAFTSAVICGALRWQALSQRPAPAPVRGRRRPQSEAGSGLLLPATAAAYIATRHSSTLLSASLFSAILNRRGVGYQLWRGSRWVPLLNHCWVPCWVPLPLLGGIGGCHARAPLPGWHAMGAIAGVPLLGAIVGAMAGCHCSVPLPDASYQP